jgi:hypothetical protein
MADAEITMPAIHIKPEDQSAPKEHWIDGEIRKAAEEIDGGRYIPDPAPSDELDAAADSLGLALGLGTGGVAVGEKPALEEFIQTRELNELARHPRVQEAMERFRREMEEAANPQEALEKSFALHELAEMESRGQRWEGQERWQGPVQEEKRIGQILTPQQFYDRLGKVVGKGRIKLSMHVAKQHPDSKSGRVGLYVRNPAWDGQAHAMDFPRRRAADLKALAEKEMAVVKRLRKLNLNTEADKHAEAAAEMVQEATEILMEAANQQQVSQTEFLRVGTLQWPLGTEWMVMRFNEFGVPTTAKYLGWRTALLTIIRAGCLTEKEAHKAFPVGSGDAADWYLEQLQDLRAERGTVQ